MWVLFLTGLLVGATVSAQQIKELAWEDNTLYTYKLQAKALTALHQVANQYSGIQIEGKFQTRINNGKLNVKLNDFKVAEVNLNISGGWQSDIPRKRLNFQPLKLTQNRFDLSYNKGAITNFTISSNAPIWEVNLLKGFASPLQWDILGTNVHKGKKPRPNSNNGIFLTMEPVVTGACETRYVYNPLPKYAVQPQDKVNRTFVREADQLLEIKKSVNFSECHQRVGFHSGLNSFTYWEPVENNLGKAISRSSSSQAIISGYPLQFTILKAITNNMLVFNPLLHNQQKGMMGSQVELILVDAAENSTPFEPINNPKVHRNLVYEHGADPVAQPMVRKYPDDSSSSSDSSSESSSSSSSSGSSSSSSSSSESASGEPKEKSYPDYNIDLSRGRRRFQPQRRFKRSHAEFIDNSPASSSSSSSSGDSSYSSSEERAEAEVESYLRSPSDQKNLKKPFFAYEHFIALPNPTDVAVQKIRSIAADLRDPEIIPKVETLETFQILLKLLQTFDEKMLQQVADDVYAKYPENPHDEKASEKYTQWTVYASALGETGTLPALVTLRVQLANERLKGQMAANTIGAVPASAIYPDEEYIKAFAGLLDEPAVINKKPLNSTALLAFGTLLRIAIADKHAAHNRFPVHSFGSLFTDGGWKLLEDYLDDLRKGLANAVAKNDSVKIQVYTAAIGNVGHSKVVDIFLPYLMGEKDVTDFQRLQMVFSLKEVAQIHPRRVLPLLVQIYQSTGETHRIRAAAVFVMMVAKPSAADLQRVAQFTNTDQHPYVIAAAVTAIKSASKLDGAMHAELAASAKAAINMLNPNVTAWQQSSKQLVDHIVEDMAEGYYLLASKIGSRDTLIPNMFYAALRTNVGGFKHLSGKASAAVSSVRDMFEELASIFGSPESTDPNYVTKARLAFRNITANAEQELEGQLAAEILSSPSIFAFNNATIQQIVEWIRKRDKPQEEHPFNQTQIVVPVDVEFGFPNALGLPSTLVYSTAAVYSVGGLMRFKATPSLSSAPEGHLAKPDSVNITVDVQVLVSRRTKGEVKFNMPALRKSYAAGYGKNSQVLLPLRIKADADIVTNDYYLKLQPIDKSNDYDLIQSSSIPYTRISYLPEITPPALDEETEIIHIRRPRVWRAVYGAKNPGMAFSVDYLSEKEFDDKASMLNWLEGHSPLSALLFSTSEYEIYYSNISFSFNPEKSLSKAVEVAWSFEVIDASYKQGGQTRITESESGSESSSESGSDSESEEEDTPTISKRRIGHKRPGGRYKRAAHPSRGSEPHLEESNPAILSAGTLDEREEKYIEFLLSRYQNPVVLAWDLQVKFAESKGDDFKLLVVSGGSPVKPESTTLVYTYYRPAQSRKSTESCTAVDAKYPRIPRLDMEKVLQANPNATVDIVLASGEDCYNGMKISAKLKAGRSQQRQLYVQQSGAAKVCRSQMKKENRVLSACRNATRNAGLLNDFSLSMVYNKVPDSYLNATYKLYSALRYWFYVQVSENPVNNTVSPGKLKARITVAPDIRSLNASVYAPLMDVHFENIRLHPQVRPWVVGHPYISRVQRWLNLNTKEQYNATCAIDAKAIDTFDNTTYELTPSSCWKVLLVTDRALRNSSDVIVLARQSQQSRREIKILIDDDEIRVKGGQSEVELKVNKETRKIGPDDIFVLDGLDGEALVRAYGLKEGGARIEVAGLILEFDGWRIELQAADHYRRHVRGLCGTFDGVPGTDFKLPENCIVGNTEVFIRAYTIFDSQCQPPQPIEEASCYPEEVIPGNSTDPDPSDPTCIEYRPRAITINDEICFSITKQPHCKDECEPIADVTKVDKFKCYPKETFDENDWDDIREGAKQPQKTGEGAVRYLPFSVPISCKRTGPSMPGPDSSEEDH